MKLIKILAIVALIAGAGFTSTASAAVAKTPPDAVVANLYKQHKKRSPFFQTKSRALLERYFDKLLADLILKDAASSKGEVGALDGDPLFNAQDMEITKFAIHKAVYREGKAEVLVSFENFGEKKAVTFVLETRRSGWKITNIKYDDGADLLGILQSESSAAKARRAVKIYLVALGDNGAHGKKIGCEDSLVAVTSLVPKTAAPLRAALEELLYISPPSGLQTFWKGRDLRLQSVSIQKQIATIHISGEVFVAGICDEPRIIGQIEETARQFSTVKRVNVFIGRRRLADAIR